MSPTNLPIPGSAAYWQLKDQALARAAQLRREAVERAFQRAASFWHLPWNWRNVRGSIG